MTRALHPALLLEMSERGRRLNPLDQALLVLSLANSDNGGDDLAALPFPERDRRLFELRQATFGDSVPCLAHCPNCGELLEFSLSAGQLLAGIGPSPGLETLAASGWEFTLRPLTSADVADAILEAGSEGAVGALHSRAIVDTRGPPDADDGQPPEDAVLAVRERVEAREAAADVALELSCATCGTAWTTGFDIGAHLWLEVDAAAQRLIGEIAMLARRFGWSENDILAMPTARRRAYLEAAGAA